MRYLIDTHVFLWFVSNSPELSQTARNILENGRDEVFLSIASLWEISIKTSLGKLTIAGDYQSVIDDVVQNSFDILSINFSHTLEQHRLPFHHRDPFDRMIVSQAIVEDLNLISADAQFDAYLAEKSVARIW